MPQVVDYSWARPAPQAIRDQGYVGAIRYLSHDPTKNLSPVERDALFAAGLSIGLVWETTARRAASGSRAGADDAGHANRQADALGWPRERPIYYAVDFDTGPEGAVRDYFDGVAGAFGRPVGVYGTYRVIEGLVGGGAVLWGWQCAAWSGNGSGTGGTLEGRRVSVHGRLYQYSVPVMGGACDANEVLRQDWGGWYPAADHEVLVAIRAAIEDATRQVLREGDEGNAVMWAQTYLNRRIGPALAVDGIFGPRTAAAVRQFQLNLRRFLHDPSISVDGIIGPVTWYFLVA